MRAIGKRIAAIAGGLLFFFVIGSIYQPYLKAISMAMSADRPRPYPMPKKLAAGMVKVDDWFVVARIDDRTFAIGEPRYGQCNFAYLMIGRDRALLWDSGPGDRDISRVVAQLTTLPVTAMPSHLHFDHVGGLRYFRDVALPDVAGLRARAKNGKLKLRRFEFLGLIENRKSPVLRVTRWISKDAEIDLGGRKLRVLGAPGHTDNSLVLLDEASGNMFTGDSIYPGYVAAFLPGADLHAFRASAARMAMFAKPGAGLFGGHGCIGVEQGLGIPRLPASDWKHLERALDQALKPQPTILLPRTLPLREDLILEAKAPWMSK
ncbi:MBL fold metallo-hydrolase [Rhizobium sp.]|uniref:MBL fold metallo-hydrolase n=1 Tax=Rhizobium sp. TaxID=391 RepID=UPI0026B18599